ncbi:MAG TPA: hypothetical protein DDW52_15690 [Planctomycetaceae bacterium]|nr:hypothetical protein [Planctomycetaceae bacterium]
MNLRKSYVDFEPYCDAILHADLRMRVLGMEQARYSIVQSIVGRIGIQWAAEGSGQLSEGSTDRDAFGLYLQLNARPRLLNGMHLCPDSVVVFPPGAEFCFACDHANSWLAVRIPTELIAVHRQEELLGAITLVRCIRSARALRTCVTSYLQAAESNFVLTQSTAAEAAFESEVLAIARRVCVRSSPRRAKSPEALSPLTTRHDRLAIEAAELIEASMKSSICVGDIANSLGVSERTLLTVFRSRFEQSPSRFIQSMRLNQARRALRNASDTGALVRDIAADYGFWDFGRFASKYQRLFGELPTQTVKNRKLANSRST